MQGLVSTRCNVLSEAAMPDGQTLSSDSYVARACLDHNPTQASALPIALSQSPGLCLPDGEESKTDAVWLVQLRAVSALLGVGAAAQLPSGALASGDVKCLLCHTFQSCEFMKSFGMRMLGPLADYGCTCRLRSFPCTLAGLQGMLMLRLLSKQQCMHLRLLKALG